MAMEGLYNMHDPRLRPCLLQSVMALHLPDDKHQIPVAAPTSPASLSVAVELIQRHCLLAEPPLPPASVTGVHGVMAKSIVDTRKGVDAWIERLMSLLSSGVAESRWAGASLLGVTSQQCTWQRFLESYILWFQKLLGLLKPTEPNFVRSAALASLTDHITRLGGIIALQGVRRDGAAITAKLVQPVVQLLGDKDSSIIWEGAVGLLCAVLRFFPACLRQHYNNVESLLVTQLMDVECSPTLLQKCVQCLALLPRAYGESSAWSSMMRRVLIAVNSQLDEAFAGMEDVNNADEAVSTLLPRGQDPPWPLGGPSVAANFVPQTTKKFWMHLVPRVSSLLQCCHFLLVSPYPVPVPVPVIPLMALVRRILRVDGSRISVASSLGISVSTAHQAALCAELPALHLCALELLHSTICGARSQLLPQAGKIAQILTDSFRRHGPTPPCLRSKLYGIARQLLYSMGAGMSEALAPVVVGNALPDLKGSTAEIFGTSLDSTHVSGSHNSTSMPGGWNQVPPQKKRKEPGGLPVAQQANGLTHTGNNIGEVKVPNAVQVAALQALEALLTVGGAMLPDRVRVEVDTLLVNVAASASMRTVSGTVTYDEETASLEGSALVSSGSFQVAAYRALLASLLSPCSHRPPHLSQGLSIFRKGRKEYGTEAAEACSHALFALEPLIHPRCLPPADTTTIVSGNIQKLGKPVIAGPLPGTIAAPSNLGFGNPLLPQLRTNQITMDPWAEVDTWLGYGEDLGEDIRGFLTEDLTNEVSPTNTQTAQENILVPLCDFSGTEVFNKKEAVPISGADLEPPEESSAPLYETTGNGDTSKVLTGQGMENCTNFVTTILATSGGEFSSSLERDIEISKPYIEPDDRTQARIENSADEEQREVHNKTHLVEGPKTPATSIITFSPTLDTVETDSDSDAIPDIIDGDPDTE